MMNKHRPLSGVLSSEQEDCSDDELHGFSESVDLSHSEEAIATYEELLRNAVPENVVDQIMSTEDNDNDMDRKRRHTDQSEESSSNKRHQLSSNGWTEEMHRSFVESLYEIGLKHASPSVILENMSETDPALTSERVKSHLQKYRNNKEKSKSDFMNDYDSWMQKALTVGAAGGASSSLATPPAITEMMGINKLLGGDLAAFLTYAVMVEEEEVSAADLHPHLLSPDAIRNGSKEYAKYFTGAKIPFPLLTEEERKSPLGISISHVLSLFYSMTQYLMKERQIREQNRASREVEGESSSAAVEGAARAEPPPSVPPGVASLNQANLPVPFPMPAQARFSGISPQAAIQQLNYSIQQHQRYAQEQQQGYTQESEQHKNVDNQEDTSKPTAHQQG